MQKLVRVGYVGTHSDRKSKVAVFRIQCGEQRTVKIPVVLCRTWPYFSNKVITSFVQLKDLIRICNSMKSFSFMQEIEMKLMT